MAQLKTFEQFISNENPVNEDHKISEDSMKELKDKIIPLTKEFGKFLTGKSTDENMKRGLIIRSHSSKLIENLLDHINHDYHFDSYWIKGKKLDSKDIYNALRDGNNQCIVFDDCEPSYLNNVRCVALLKNAFSDDDEYCVRIHPDPRDIDVENKRYHLCFRGIIIIICSETKDEIDKVLLDKFEFIDLTK